MKRADLIAVLLVLALAGASLMLFGQSESSLTPVAVIYKDGVIVQRIPLSRPQSYLMSGNELLIEPDGVTMLWADCHSQDCVHTGKLTRPGLVIACLPNRVMVILEGGGHEEEYDAIAG